MGSMPWGTSNIIVNAQAMQACPTGTVTQVSYAFNMTSGAKDGVSITIGFGSALDSAAYSVQVGDFDLRYAGTDTNALQALAIPEILPLYIEYLHAQQFLPAISGLTNAFSASAVFYTVSGTTSTAYIAFNPIVEPFGSITGAIVSSPSDWGIGAINSTLMPCTSLVWVQAGTAPGGGFLRAHWVGSNTVAGLAAGQVGYFTNIPSDAYILFTGAEISGPAI